MSLQEYYENLQFHFADKLGAKSDEEKTNVFLLVDNSPLKSARTVE